MIRRKRVLIMLVIPTLLQARFENGLRKKQVPNSLHGTYKKWLRYYLDFCRKYDFPNTKKESLPNFISKLNEKGQTNAQREQAAKSISLYYEIIEQVSHKTPTCKHADSRGWASLENSKTLPIREAGRKPAPYGNGAAIPTRGLLHKRNIPVSAPEPQLPEKAFIASGQGASWEAQFASLENEIRVRHYSPQTLKTYRGWTRKFQAFVRSKSPEMLSTEDVKTYLTYLAVKRNVSASTQNQAFNSLLFFFRHVLKREFGKIDGIVRAKRKPYIPVVLSRDEIDEVLKHLESPYDLVVKLLYGCGLRLFECLKIRLNCLNFDARVLTIHDGKGKKDRTVPLPEKILPELRAHFESLKNLHERDLKRNYAGVFLMDALELKYKNAAKEFVWQWFFPAKQLTRETDSGEYIE